MAREPLGVWLHGIRVAELTSKKPGEVRCTYTADALERWPSNVPLLSCSLPLRRGVQSAGPFFSGLLPEGQHRHAMAALAKVPSYDTYGMLAHFGRDVAGALVVSGDEPDDRAGTVEPYDAATLASEVSGLEDNPLGLHDDSELSIAGLQDKILLVALPNGRWGRPVGGRPSTHILKVETRGFPGIVAAEAACLRLARAVGLTTIDVQTETIADLECLIVSRFDRNVGSDGSVSRVHQEDACQALACNSEAAAGKGKYESAGGPSFMHVADLLDLHAREPEAQLLTLLDVLLFTLCIGNADGHGKNLALMHATVGDVQLAPIYDTVPTVLWPKLRKAAAMSINGRSNLASVNVDDILAEATRWKLPDSVARTRCGQTLQQLRVAATDSDIAHEGVVELVQRQAARLLDQLAQG